MSTKLNYAAILTEAFEAARTAPCERPQGCARVYVYIQSKEHRRGISAAAKKTGKIYQAKAHYGLVHVLYVGYDTGNGKVLAGGTAIVETLQKYGITAFREEAGD